MPRVSIKILSHDGAKNKAETVQFQILYFYWSFSSGVMAVKGLTLAFEMMMMK